MAPRDERGDGERGGARREEEERHLVLTVSPIPPLPRVMSAHTGSV
jgi:hypothetical protein